MKTKALFILCLLFGIGLTKIAGQDWIPSPPENKNVTGTIPVVVAMDYSIPVLDETGTQIDLLVGTITAHMKFKWQNGVLKTLDYNAKSSLLESQETNEVFKAIEIGKQDVYSNDLLDGFTYFRFNIIGNMGTHYKGEGTLDWAVGEFTFDNVVLRKKAK